MPVFTAENGGFEIVNFRRESCNQCVFPACAGKENRRGEASGAATRHAACWLLTCPLAAAMSPDCGETKTRQPP